MPLKAETGKRKKRNRYKHRIRGAWIALIALCSMIVLGAILFASADNYDWLFKP
jgi:hypothetical protein